jgi:hypothetical protein
MSKSKGFNKFSIIWALFSIFAGISAFGDHGSIGISVLQMGATFLLLYLPIGFIVGFTEEQRVQRKLKKEEELERRKKEREHSQAPVREKISSLHSEIESLELVDTSSFLQSIKDDEEVIIKFGGVNVLQDFIRLGKFLTNIESRVTEKFNNIPIRKNDYIHLSNAEKHTLELMGSKIETIEEYYRKLRGYKLNLESLIKYHYELYQISLIFLQLLIVNNKTEFYSIREKFDEIGIFRTGFENEMLNKLDTLNNNLGVISIQLESIKSSLRYQNALITLNTFQLKSINEKLGNKRR